MTAAAEYGFAFRDPAWLWSLAIVLAVVVWRWRRRDSVPFAAASLAAGDLATGLGLPPLPRSRRQRVQQWLPALEAIALALLVVGLARPVQRSPLPPERAGADVLLCIDRSSSMLATDLGGGRTRLAVAVEAAAEFVRARGEDRVGLVTFARYPDLRCPPTLDHDTAVELLRAVVPVAAEGPEDATGIGTAVTFAIEALQRAAVAGQVVVLLTDGEENVATSATPHEIAPLHAAQLAAELGVRVHGIVVGAAAPGRELDTAAVRQLAGATGGRFFTARDAAALRATYRDIDAIEKTAFVEPRLLVREWFVWCLLGGLLCSGLWGLGVTSSRAALP